MYKFDHTGARGINKKLTRLMRQVYSVPPGPLLFELLHFLQQLHPFRKVGGRFHPNNPLLPNND